MLRLEAFPPSIPARPSPPMAMPLALRPLTEIVVLSAAPPGPARAAPEALPCTPIERQLAFFCETLVATQEAADPMAMARPLVLPTGLEAGVLWAPPQLRPMAMTMEASESATVRQPLLLVKVKIPVLE